MSEISRLTGVNIEHVCNGGVSTLWTRILDDIVLKEISTARELNVEKKQDRNLLLERYYNRGYSQSPALQVQDEVCRILEDEESEDEECLMKRRNRKVNY